MVQCIHGCANIQFPSGTPRNRLPSPPSLTELWIRCGVYKGTQSRSPKILFLPPWCPMATTWIGETQLLPFPSLWHYMVQTAFGPEFLGNPGFYSELIHSCCSEHSHCTRGWYLLQKPFWTISPDVDHPPCFPPPKTSFVRTCRCSNSWASLKATVDPAKAQRVEPAPWANLSYHAADHCRKGAQGWGT